MKLKKIASLALAGLMAVSMLAGCGDKANGGNSNNNNGVVSSSIVDAVNNGQDSYNDVKVTFTADSNLENIAKSVFEKQGEYAYWSLDTVKANIAQYATLLDTVDTVGSFYGDKADLTVPSTDNCEDGDKVTFFDVIYVADSSSSDAYRTNVIVDGINTLVAALDDTTLVTADDSDNPTEDDATYYDFSYTGKICMIEVPTASGYSEYYLVVVLEQTVAEKTV